MNDLYTLLVVRDELEKDYQYAKTHSKARSQWSGLLAARNTIHRLIQEATDERNAHMDMLEAQAGG